MGSFFTNVQVFAGERSVEEVREAVIAELRRLVTEAGLEEDDSLEEEDAERVIMIGPPGPERWIAVYDQITEDQDPNCLRELGEALSRVGAATVTVMVHDSDILMLGLCEGGAEVDVFNSYPNYYREDPDEPRAPATGEAARWSGVLAPGASPEMLRTAWEIQDLFAEDTVTRLAGIMGWSMERCSLGFRDLSEVSDEVDGFTRLAFRPSAQAAADRPAIFAEGPPRFEQGGGQVEIAAVAGARFEGVGASFRSAGGAGRGVRVVIWGPSLEQGLLKPRTIWLVWTPSPDGQHERREIALETSQTAEGVPPRFVTFEGVPIPAGLSEAVLASPSSPEAAARPDLASHGAALMQALRAAGLTMHRMMDLMAATQIGVSLVGEAVQAGSGQLHVGIMPLQHPAGQTSWTFEVTIRES